jgi:hypothetical protein
MVDMERLKAASATLNRISDMATGVRRECCDYMLQQIRQAAIAWIDGETVRSTCGPKELGPVCPACLYEKMHIDGRWVCECDFRRLCTLNTELVEACEAHEAWAEAEDKHLGSFHDRMEIGNLSEYLTRKALAMVRGQEFTDIYKGVPQLIIRTNAKAQGSE